MRKRFLNIFLEIFLIFLISFFIFVFFNHSSFLIKKISIYFLIVFFLGLIFLLYFIETMINPLKELKKGFKKLSEGKFDFQLKKQWRNKFLKDLISEFNKALINLRKHKKKQEILNRMKSDFVSMTAHQFRRPITEIKWILKMFLDGEFGKLEKKQLEMIKQAFKINESLNILVDDLLNLAKIEDKRSNYQFSSVQIENLIQEVIENLKFSAQKKEIEIIYQRPSEKLPLLKADPQKLKLVIFNLIDNAIRYSYKKNKVIIGIEKEDSFLKVWVKDFGIGIKKLDQPHIFEKFFRSSTAREKEIVGSGLGLYIVKNIINQHKGKVGFSSQENKGSKFWFTLPLK